MGGPWLLAVGGSELGLTGDDARGRAARASAATWAIEEGFRSEALERKHTRMFLAIDADAQNISADDGGRTENEVGVARKKRRSEGEWAK